MLKSTSPPTGGLNQTPVDSVGFLGAWKRAQACDDGNILSSSTNSELKRRLGYTGSGFADAFGYSEEVQLVPAQRVGNQQMQ